MAEPLSLGLMAAGGVLKAFSAFRQTQQAAATLRFNAKVAQRNAEQQARNLERDAQLLVLARQREEDGLAFDLETFDRTASRVGSTMVADIGASGLEFSGSNLLVAMAQAEELALQREVIEFASLERQADLGDDEAFLRFQAEQTRATGDFSQGILREQAREVRRNLPFTLSAAAIQTGSMFAGQFARPRGGLLRNRSQQARGRVLATTPTAQFPPGE